MALNSVTRSVSPDPAQTLPALTASYIRSLEFYLNGTRIILDSLDAGVTLLDYLKSVGLSGTKRGCDLGGCGACTVVISNYDPAIPKICHLSVNACLIPIISLDGKHVITIEGIGNVQRPHPVQERIALYNGSQCGFCTPGIVMTLYALLRNNPSPSSSELEEAFIGNLCRCTGYRPILDAAQSFAEGCCQLKTGGFECCRLRNIKEGMTKDAFAQPKFIKYDQDTELIFPPQLMKHVFQPLAIENGVTNWYRPITLEQLDSIMSQDPSVVILAGNTESRLSHDRISKNSFAFIGQIADLQQHTLGDDHVEFGANVTFTDLEKISSEALVFYGATRAQAFTAIRNQLGHFSRQIKNSATVAGSLASRWHGSDLNTILVVVKAVVITNEKGLKREIPAEIFFSKPAAISHPRVAIVSVRIPIMKVEDEFLRAYRQAKRKDADNATVNASFRVYLSRDNKAVQEAMFVYGGICVPNIVFAASAAEYALGKHWPDPETLKGIMAALEQDFGKFSREKAGISTFNKSVVLGFFYRFYYEILSLISSKDEAIKFEGLVSSTIRTISTGTKDDVDTVTRAHQASKRPNNYDSAIKYSTGQAEFIDDIPPRIDEIHGCLVLSIKPRARLVDVDTTAVLRLPGVVDYVDKSDFPDAESNIWGAISDEVYMAVDEVFTAGQVIGMILATSPAQARLAAKQVRVIYEELPAILTLDEAIAKESYFEQYDTKIVKGDVKAAFARADHIISGTSRIGGQEHFYMETQSCLVIPNEGDEIVVWSATQSPSETQRYISRACNLPMNKVTVKVKRLGGGFGGKGSRSVQIAAISAVAARKHCRPVRCVLSREEDMITTGQRHPFIIRWKVGLMTSGKFLALDADLVCKAGWSMDLSGSVCDHAMWHIDNCYYFPNVHVRGQLARTNTMSNTAFRGFGAPQGMFITETFMTEMADVLGMSVEMLREINFYREGDYTHFDQKLEDWHIPLLYQRVKQNAEYARRTLDIQIYNQTHRWKKRGLALIPTKFGISFTALQLNQGGALVQMHSDGSVSLSHGGVEMGQGLYAKMTTIAAEILHLPASDIHITETATDKIPNTSATAASVSSDLNGYAVTNACKQIVARLAPYRTALGQNATMKDVAVVAIKDGINLSAIGHYKTPGLSATWGHGRIFNYFTQGVAAAEVEIDCLTGEWNCLRADIMMDIGQSIDQDLDFGQIEGAFIQGLGLFTLEEPLWSHATGSLVTTGPTSYKIPGSRDIPQVMNISILREDEDVSWKHLHTVHRSRGVGEPPLFLGSAVFFAIRNALQHARWDVGVRERLCLDSPATVERIRLTCRDEIVQRVRSSSATDDKDLLFSI